MFADIDLAHPLLSVTFIDNHDTQKGQSLESSVDGWFKEIAYGIIFLRRDGYPCLFYGDYYGLVGEEGPKDLEEKIRKLAKIRRAFAYGDQDDYFQSPTLLGWVRHGDENHP